jgi:hypothetical protein
MGTQNSVWRLMIVATACQNWVAGGLVRNQWWYGNGVVAT